MIFVTVGTQDKAFDRLFKYIDEANIDDRVVIQSGYTNYQSNKYEVFDYLDKDKFEAYLKQADIIICHGGIGTIMHSLFEGKKVIACARLSKYQEHANDHQLQIISELKNKGYILELNEENRLDDLLQEAKHFEVPKLEKNQDNFVSKLRDYINKI